MIMSTARSLFRPSVLGRVARVAPARPIARQFHASAPRSIVHEIKSKEQFTKALEENKAVIVDCTASWCGPCRVIGPIFERMSNEVENEGVHFVKVDVDELPELAAELGVRAMPTFIVMHNGKPVQQMLGADKNGLEKLVDKASLLN